MPQRGGKLLDEAIDQLTEGPKTGEQGDAADAIRELANQVDLLGNAVVSAGNAIAEAIKGSAPR